MKRIGVLLLSVCLILPLFTSCAADAPRTVTEAMEKTEALDAFEASLEIAVTSAEGVVAKPLCVNFAVVNAHADAAMRAVVEADENEVVDVYQFGEWFYVTDRGVSYKTRTNAFSSHLDYMSYARGLLQTLPEGVAAEMIWIEEEKTAQASLSPAAFGALYGVLLERLVPFLGVETAYEDATLTVAVEDGYVSFFGLEFGRATSGDRVAITLFFPNPGGEAKVTPPYGFQNYPEYALS